MSQPARSAPARRPLPQAAPSWAVGDSYDRVIAAVTGRVQQIKPIADGVMINCLNPAHPDRHPSLHVWHVSTPYGGRTRFYCHTCQDGISQEDFAGWAGLDFDDLFDDRRWDLHHRAEGPVKPVRQRRTGSTFGRLGPLPKPIADAVHQLLGEPAPAPDDVATDEHTFEKVETYLYLDPSGIPFHRVHRMRCTDRDCTAKNFPQEYLRPGSDPSVASNWRSTKAGAGLPSTWTTRLYRHAQVELAVSDGTPVWILEGEKDVHTAEGEAVVATTNPGGGKNFAAHLAEPFRGADEVCAVHDRDPVGYARAVRLEELLHGVGAGRVRHFLPATTEPKSDFTDHIRAGHQVGDLLEVPVAAFEAWDHLSSRVAQAIATIFTCEAEVGAQLRVAEHERAHGKKASAADRRKYAIRWAKEASRAHTKLHEAAQAVAAAADSLIGQDPLTLRGREWADEAADMASTQLRTAGRIVTALFEQVGQIAPPEVQTAAVTRAVVPPAAAPVTASAAPAEAAPHQDTPGHPAPAGSKRDRQNGDRPGLYAIPGGGGGGRQTRGHVEHDEYEVWSGELTQVFWRTKGEETQQIHKRVINVPIFLNAKEIAESDDDIEAQTVDLNGLGDRDGRSTVRIRSLSQVTHVVLQVPGADGQPSLVRVPFDDWDTGSFLAHLPVAQLNYNRSRSGREKVITAINYVSPHTEVRTSYRATGWRTRADGSSMYVTAAGAIDAEGYLELPTNLSGPIARFDMPNPTTVSARIRQAFDHATAPLVDRLPDRVGAVMVGQAFRASLCPNEWVTVLSAPPGSYKTGIASLAMHYFGELWDRNRPVTTMSGNGATTNALRIYANQAKDAVLFLDDNAPTTGVQQAWERLEATCRLIHNEEGRGRAGRDGQSALPETRPRTSGLITTELPPRAGASGGRRALLVPIEKHDISLDDIKALDAMDCRHGRALLMSSFLRWVAEDHTGALVRAKHLRDTFLRELGSAQRWVRRTPARVVQDHGVKVAELWSGWGLLLDFLLEVKAMTPAEVNAWTLRIQEALALAAESADDPDMVDSTGSRVCELLRFALSTGLAFVKDIQTGLPPAGLEQRMGWKENGQVTSDFPGYPDYSGTRTAWKPDPRAILLGYVNSDPALTDGEPELVCDRPALSAVLKAAASQQPDTSTIDLATAIRALEEEGVLKTLRVTKNGGTLTRRSIDRTIPCLKQVSDPNQPARGKRIVLRLAQLFDEQGIDEQNPDGLGPDDPNPNDPRHDGPGCGPSAPSDPAGQADPGGPSAPADPGSEAPMVLTLIESDQSVDDPASEGAGDTTDEIPGSDEHAAEPEGSEVSQTNAGGLTLQKITHFNTIPCDRCGLPCGVEFVGRPLHLPCFWQSTASTVDELTAELAQLRADRLNEQQTNPPVTPPAARPAAAPAATAASPTAPTEPTAVAAVTAAPLARASSRRPHTGHVAAPFRAAVAVVGPERYWLPDGTTEELPMAIEHLGHLDEIGRRLQLGAPPVGWHTIAEPGLVIPTAELWAQLGVDVTKVPALPSKRRDWLAKISADLPALHRAVSEGWVFGRQDDPDGPQLRGCLKPRRLGEERGQIRILLSVGFNPEWGVDPDVDPAAAARRFQLFADLVGIPFCSSGSPISTAEDLFKASTSKATRDGLQPVNWDTIAPANLRTLEEHFDWTRTPAGDEASKALVMLWDRGQSYLATWANVRLGYGAPERREGPVAFDPKLAGWWRITIPDDRLDGHKLVHPFPDLLDPHGTYAGQQRWVTTPALAYAVKNLEVTPDISEAWVWPESRSGRALEGFYKVIRNALAQLHAMPGQDARAVEVMVKTVYKQFSGYFISEGAATKRDGLHQPYWFHATIAQARVAILHQILKTGRRDGGAWPLVVSNNDLVGYAADEVGDTGWPGDDASLGVTPGKYKPSRYAALDEHLPHLTGGRWTGLDATQKYERVDDHVDVTTGATGATNKAGDAAAEDVAAAAPTGQLTGHQGRQSRQGRQGHEGDEAVSQP